MAQLITRTQNIVDHWLVYAEKNQGDTTACADQSPLPQNHLPFTAPQQATIYPLALWQAERHAILAAGHPIGILLETDERVEDIADDLAHFALIALNFPKFVDGRHYSSAALLRQRYRYTGEVRALGNILHDQLFYLSRVGFDSYALSDGKDAAYALDKAFTVFSAPYQGSSDCAQPHFCRSAAPQS
ncbi:DUF934 domain-containing protein [Azonexus sp.]|uniref:DUF934 domain-containing protein n=1 Tax=Azonexus sp. TaxID=1872668 RepID=UPI0039E3B840